MVRIFFSERGGNKTIAALIGENFLIVGLVQLSLSNPTNGQRERRAAFESGEAAYASEATFLRKVLSVRLCTSILTFGLQFDPLLFKWIRIGNRHSKFNKIRGTTAIGRSNDAWSGAVGNPRNGFVIYACLY